MKIKFLFLFIFSFSISYAQLDSAILNKLSFSAFLDSYISYDNYSNTKNERPSFIFNYHRNRELAVNLAGVELNYNAEKLKLSVNFADGSFVSFFNKIEPNYLNNLLNANVAFKLSKRKNTWLYVGIFPSHIGFEGFKSYEYHCLTRSLLAESTPYILSGTKIQYQSTNQKWLLSFSLLNGWSHLEQLHPSKIPSAGTQITYSVTEDLLLNSSTFLSIEERKNMELIRYFHNFYMFKNWNRNQIQFGVDACLFSDTKTNKNFTTIGAVLSYKRILNKNLSFTLRAETYNDKKQLMISTDFSNQEFKAIGTSANIDYTIYKKAMLRYEIRNIYTANKSYAYISNKNKNNLLLNTIALCVWY
jgi:hypothetical protein